LLPSNSPPLLPTPSTARRLSQFHTPLALPSIAPSSPLRLSPPLPASRSRSGSLLLLYQQAPAPLPSSPLSPNTSPPLPSPTSHHIPSASFPILFTMSSSTQNRSPLLASSAHIPSLYLPSLSASSPRLLPGGALLSTASSLLLPSLSSLLPPPDLLLASGSSVPPRMPLLIPCFFLLFLSAPFALFL